MTTQNTTSKKPTHMAYLVKDKNGSDKPVWIKVGAVWEHADKDGFNLILNLLGQDVNLTVRRNKPKLA